MDITLYSELGVKNEIKKAVDKLGFEEMTEIQSRVIPVMLSGSDVVAKAPTGTGKTFAFGIPIVERIDPENTAPQALILAPTRELATQIQGEIRKLCAFLPDVRSIALYGGQPINQQITALKKRPQIIVATPGRLLDHIRRHTVKLAGVRIAVCDEADEMLDMGFFKDVSEILKRLPEDKQLTMFSATITREVMDIMWLFQRDSVEITVEAEADTKPKITQYSIECSGGAKTDNLVKLIKTYGYERVMVFCNTRRMTDILFHRLKEKGFSVEALSSDINQTQRTKIMNKFKAEQISVLVSTDVAARGIDVNDVDAVFNYDVPQDNAYYLHRIGRTGRAKKEGVSYVFYDFTEAGRLKDIIRYTHSDIRPAAVSSTGELVEIKKEK
ncbi:MAG: DEAD/DEAH box helicase [Clostridia bacterium]|nr:DEAD/DEAH box helicase [Clostridia bacterium]